jgi:cell division septum initiation protein DivIVA
MRGVALNEADPYELPRKFLNFEVERLTCHVETRDEEFGDLHALARRSESRIVALSEQLSRSRAELESTSTRFSELAQEIPTDVAGLSGQLSRILNAASVEAEEIRAEAHRYADAIRVESEERAAKLVSEAQLEYDSARAVRADLEAQGQHIRADVARLRERAAINAADIVREAKATAEEILARVHHDVDVQRALAQTQLDELIQVRANIAAQLRDFYNKFQQLDGPVVRIDRLEGVCADSDPAELSAAGGAHAAPDMDFTHEALRSIG